MPITIAHLRQLAGLPQPQPEPEPEPVAARRRPAHLTARDAKFLGAVGRGSVEKLDAIIELADDLATAADKAGVSPDWRSVESLDTEGVIDDPAQLDAIAGDLRHQIGAIGRGEPSMQEIPIE